MKETKKIEIYIGIKGEKKKEKYSISNHHWNITNGITRNKARKPEMDTENLGVASDPNKQTTKH